MFLYYSYGRQQEFNCDGIRLAVDYFRKRGHDDITVVLPRHYQMRGGQYFNELERSGILT